MTGRVQPIAHRCRAATGSASATKREAGRSAAAAHGEPDRAATDAQSGPAPALAVQAASRPVATRSSCSVSSESPAASRCICRRPGSRALSARRMARHGHGQIVDLTEHRHDARDEVDRRSEVGGGRQQRGPAVLRDGRITEQRDRQPKVASGVADQRRPGVARKRIRACGSGLVGRGGSRRSRSGRGPRSALPTSQVGAVSSATYGGDRPWARPCSFRVVGHRRST